MARMKKCYERIAHIRIEIVCLILVVSVLGILVFPAFASDEEHNICECYDVTRKSSYELGGFECQHGPEQDVDCWIFAIAQGGTQQQILDRLNTIPCDEDGGQAPNPVPGWNNIPVPWQNLLTQAGFNANMADGKCECFKCQKVAQGVANHEGDCEGYTESFGAWCEKNKTGDCETDPNGSGTGQVHYQAKLKMGKNACDAGANQAGGLLEVKFCGGTMLTAPDFSIKAAKCISQDCEEDLAHAFAVVPTEDLRKCKNPSPGP